VQDQCALNIRVIHLKQSDRTLYSTICAQLGQEKPAALMVSGLATVDNLDDMLRATNQVREEFRKNFHFPVILWINDAVHVKFLRIAPDFESWTTTTRFAIPTDELIEVLQQNVESLFATALAVNSSQSLYKLTDVLAQGCLSRSELDLALKELPYRVQDLDPQLEAGLQFIRGLNGGDSPEALEYFQQSLTFWQQVGAGFTDNLSHQTDNLTKPAPINAKLKAGLVLFHIGLYHYRTTDRKKHQDVNWQTSKINLQHCLDLFDQENRPDLVAKCITQLERVLQRMQAWDELEQVAKKALPLHKQYGSTSKLAQDYSFLAEVALQQQRWDDARQAAQQAEDIISQLPKHKQWIQGLNLLFLAQAERQLGNKQAAISHLVKARELGDFGHPLIYVRILEALRELYFEERQYLAAFATKQLRRSIEQQYGIRAFIGAGRLQPHRQEASAKTDNQESVAPEIIASGRQRDLERLLERIGRNDCKLIIIHGRSGVGKSSLVNAGLVPALKQSIIGTQKNVPILIRVYTTWIEELEKQLLNDDDPVGAGLDANLSGKPITAQQNPPDSLGLDNNFSEKSPTSQQNQPYAKILEQLRQDEQRQRRTVLIFDQFEEFFFVYTNPAERRLFWQFLADCLNILSVKVILSLREDYLHYLLECNRLVSMSVIGHDILGKNVLYELGNFSPTDARAIIEDLTTRSRFYLDPALIDQLVKDLAGTTGEILPIELQVVGAQLQAENIKTLAEYRELGTKEELVKRYLEEVVEDCGAENKQAAELVLYLLTDEKGTRPLKTHAELERDLEGLAADLTTEANKLDLVLRIFVDSGLVFLLPETPYEHYQLVHDYLAEFIRKNQKIGLLAELAEAKEKQKVTEAKLRQALQDKEELLCQEKQDRKRAEIAEIEALSSLSQALLLSHDQLGALLASVKAGKKLQQTEVPSESKTRIVGRLWQAIYSVQEYNRFQGDNSALKSISYSPDGQILASGSEDGIVKLWGKDGTIWQTWHGHSKEVWSVCFSPDGQIIASASLDCTVRLWRLDGTEVQTFRGHSAWITSVSFSPDGQMIASASRDRTVKLWRLDGTEVQTFRGHSAWITSVSFSPDGQMIASTSRDRTVKLWRLDGTEIRTFEGHTDQVWSVSFSPDSQMIASASYDQTIKLWHLDGTLLRTFQGHSNWVIGVSFSPDGQMIASASTDHTVKVWRLDGKVVRTFVGHSSSVYSVSFSPDGQMIASASRDRTIKVWRLYDTAMQIFQGHKDWVNSLSFSPDSSTFVSASRDRTVKLCHLDGTVVQTFRGHKGSVYGVSFSPDGQMIASASTDHTVKLWHLDGTVVQTFRGHKSSVYSVSFSPNGQMIASASRDCTVKLWRLDGTLIQTFKGHSSWVNHLSFSPDGQMIASASTDHTVKLWRLDGTLVQTFDRHRAGVNNLSFSPDRQMIASASTDQTVKLWRLDGTVLQTFHEHSAGVKSVSFSPDGQMIASASDDRTVKLWRLDGTVVQTFYGHSAGVRSISFSPDGQIIASASDDRTVILRNLDLNNLLIIGCNWLRDYLKTNPNVSESDRRICDGINSNS
jgi:WD40 repeat protein